MMERESPVDCLVGKAGKENEWERLADLPTGSVVPAVKYQATRATKYPSVRTAVHTVDFAVVDRVTTEVDALGSSRQVVRDACVYARRRDGAARTRCCREWFAATRFGAEYRARDASEQRACGGALDSIPTQVSKLLRLRRASVLVPILKAYRTAAYVRPSGSRGANQYRAWLRGSNLCSPSVGVHPVHALEEAGNEKGGSGAMIARRFKRTRTRSMPNNGSCLIPTNTIELAGLQLAVSHSKLLGQHWRHPALQLFRGALPLFCHSPINSVAGSMDNQPSPAVTKTAHRRHAQHGINNYYARQLMPQAPFTTSSSSYDYWWPYPPGGVPATSTTPIPADTLLASPASAPVLAFSVQSDPALSPAFDSLSAASSSFDSLSAASSSFDSISVIPSSSSDTSSPSASESIVSISALPPSSTNVATNSHSKISMLPTSNLVYIVPICAVVGLLIGGITAWCVYGCLTRNGHDRRRGRKSYGTLEVGPEYRPPSPQREKQEPGEGEWVGNEKHAGENQNDNEDNAKENNSGDASDDDERGTETQGFLHPGSAQTRPARSSLRTKSSESAATSFYSAAPTTKSTRDPSPTPSGRTSLFFDRPDPSDALPWESLRHKSIKRGILERLRFDAPKGPGQNRDMDMDTTDGIARRPQWQAHGRHDSDLLVKDAQAAADLSRASSSLWLSRASSAVTASTKPGFRIMQESPARTPQGERGADVFRWPSVRGEGAGDKYTRVPERVARSRSRSPEKASPTKYERGGSPDKFARATSPPVRRGGRGRKAQMDDTDADPADFRSVLPQSPPRISSPVLDDALCFASPVPQSPEPNPGMGMASFASFGAPTADEEWLMKRRAGERALRGGERERR
ncbi:hypothetical protein C8R47DRAFT_1200459 [Mycena vitilis]|nr:hypothetical protein C8R47DRAFT_1200459 [Mycena vitilis]